MCNKSNMIIFLFKSKAYYAKAYYLVKINFDFLLLLNFPLTKSLFREREKKSN